MHKKNSSLIVCSLLILFSVSVKGLIAGTSLFELKVTNTAGLTSKDTIIAKVNNTTTNTWPVVPPPICSQSYKIVVLGSSTAYGIGASPIDSSFVNKFRTFVQQQNSQSTVINLATPGINSYHVNPSDYIPPANRPLPDTARNITKGLSLNPDAIIINLPSNDIAAGYSIQEFEDNINLIVSKAADKNVPVWVTTTQPRTNLNLGERNNQVILRDWINQRFGNFSIDFWTTVAQGDTINPVYAFGDGIHLNNDGHHILFTRIVYAQIWDTLCNRNYGPPVNKIPVAKAGNDVTLNLPNTAALNGTASYDTDGIILSYKWRKISGPLGALIANDTARQTTVSFTKTGIYKYELTVTDNKAATGKDSIIITLNAVANKPPVANAGLDNTIQLPANRVLLDGRNSSDPDGSITTYNWSLLNGPSGSQILTPAKDTTSVTFINSGTYIFSLNVSDNKSATASDSVIINVEPIAVSGKIIKVNIYDGANPYNNTQWNNWNTNSSLSSSSFYYEDRTTSSVNAVLSAQKKIIDNGANYATTATICPSAIYRYTSQNSANRTLTIKGLRLNSNYGFEFYSSRNTAGNNNSTIYTIGALSDTINTDKNISDYAKFDNILSDSKGTIVITLKKIGANQFINGFIIKEEFTSGRVNKKPGQADAKIIEPVTLAVYPNPFINSFNIKLNNTITGPYKMQLINAEGKIVFSKQGLINTNLFSDQINTGYLQKGIYFLQVFTNQNKLVRKLIKK